jgi:hypothetical protein
LADSNPLKSKDLQYVKQYQISLRDAATQPHFLQSITQMKFHLPYHQLWTILQRFCQMHGLDFITSRQICDSTR